MSEDRSLPDPRRLDRLLAEQRLEQLRQEIDSLVREGRAPPPLEAAAVRLRGELAWRGMGPVSDLVIAARALLQAGDPAGCAMTAHAVRAVAAAGAAALARELLDDALERWPGDAGLDLVREQLAGGRFRGNNRALYDIEALILEGEHGPAKASLVQYLDADLSADDRMAGLMLLSALHSARREFEDAGESLARTRELLPRADRSSVVGLRGALNLWAAGRVEAAIPALKELREATRLASGSAERVEDRFVHGEACSVLEALDRDPVRSRGGPRWSFLDASWLPVVESRCPGRAAGLVELAGGGTARGELSEGEMPTMAHLTRALAAAGCVTSRIFLDEERMTLVIEEGAHLWLEEERASESGFLLVVGYDPVARLVLLKDPRRITLMLRSVESQFRHSALHGRSTLLVGGAGAEGRERLSRLAARGVEHLECLELADRCDLDAGGRAPSQARVTSLALEAIAAAPDLPVLHKRHGESLLGQLRMGNIEPGPAGPYERWLARARRKFPDAEWPHQIHARALELQDRYEEAGIAWSDAAICDPYDARNIMGQARVASHLGRLPAADRLLRDAITLEAGLAEAHARRAEIALELEKIGRAELHARLALEMAPDTPRTMMASVSVSERTGDLAEATEQLGQIVEMDPGNAFAHVRLLRRRAQHGDWQEATRLAALVCKLVPGTARAWETAAWVAWAAGDMEVATSLSMTGIQRCGAEADLLEGAIRIITTGLGADQARGALALMSDLLGGAPMALLDVANSLCHRSWFDEAIALAERARGLMPSDPNGSWRLVQVMMMARGRGAGHDERVDRLLEEVIEKTTGYALPRVILGWRLLATDPGRALDLVSNADSALAPGPIWQVQAHALERLGRRDEAAQVLALLPEVYPDGVLGSVDLLRQVGMNDLCHELLSSLTAAMPDSLDARMELARTLGVMKDEAGRLRLLLEVDRIDGRAVPLGWLLDAAEAVEDWEVVQEAARRIITAQMYDSTSGFDCWPVRARRAGARLARGDGSERERVLDLAPNHPGVLAALVRIERRRARPEHEEDRARLRAVAPGLFRTLETEEVGS